MKQEDPGQVDLEAIEVDNNVGNEDDNNEECKAMLDQPMLIPQLL